MRLRPGMRLQSVACTTEVIIVRASADDDRDLRCGGHPMVPIGENVRREELLGDQGEGTLIGKRYGGEDLGVEILCTKAGVGGLSMDDSPISRKDAKPLPSSD
jgi:hypothetical protein